MRSMIIGVILLILPQTAFVQNLVPNPGFEEIMKQPCRWMQSKRQFERYIKHWTSPTETNPDLYSTAGDPTCWSHPNKHSGGRQSPHTGEVMAGIKTYGTGGLKKNHVDWHEYVQVKFIKPMEVGKKYYAEVYVQREFASSMASNNIGFYFSTEEINTGNRLPLCFQPHINNTKVIKSNLFLWERVSGVIKADQPYKYVLIGNFYGNHETKFENMPQGKNDAHYYLDDVLVRLAEKNQSPTPRPPECVPPPMVEVKETTTKKHDLEEISFDVGNKIELSNIYFEHDKAILLPESKDELTKLYNTMYNYPYMEIEVHGHTDNTGDATYNQRLSEQRAQAVADWLVAKKVKPERITAKGFGMSQPIASNDTDEGRELNRRVEFIVKKIK